MRPKPLVLIVLDGSGCAPASKANAIALARKPEYDKLLAEFPNTLIHTSGRYVGLPTGQMGNSEVGHLNIGAGRGVYMDITKIDVMIENGEFFKNPVLAKAMANAKTGGHQLHICGLLSDGGVHSHQNHLYALLKMAKQQDVERVLVHPFMDGRDTLPTNGVGYIEQLLQKMREFSVGKIASGSGRYYAMDRDKRWPREKLAYDAMVHGRGEAGGSTHPGEGFRRRYKYGPTEEVLAPFGFVGEEEKAGGRFRGRGSGINVSFRVEPAPPMN